MARRVSPPVRAWRWSKRNPKLAAATGAAFCSATAATFLFFSHEGLSSLAAVAATAIAFCSAIAVPFLFFSRKTTSSLAPPAKSIAVLPFENLGDQENVYLTQGMQDEILNNLARIADLRVISRTSVMDYRPEQKRNLRQIAEELACCGMVGRKETVEEDDLLHRATPAFGVKIRGSAMWKARWEAGPPRRACATDRRAN